MDDDARRLLAVFAHPDDESFMAGGTLALYAERGWDVRVVCATSGEGGRRGPYASLSQSEFAAVRRAELRSACEALGIPSPTFLHSPDGAVGQTIAELEKQVLEILSGFQPQVVMTFGPDGISGHPDHLAVHAVVSGAFAEWLYATRSKRDALWPRCTTSFVLPRCRCAATATARRPQRERPSLTSNASADASSPLCSPTAARGICIRPQRQR